MSTLPPPATCELVSRAEPQSPLSRVLSPPKASYLILLSHICWACYPLLRTDPEFVSALKPFRLLIVSYGMSLMRMTCLMSFVLYLIKFSYTLL